MIEVLEAVADSRDSLPLPEPKEVGLTNQETR